MISKNWIQKYLNKYRPKKEILSTGKEIVVNECGSCKYYEQGKTLSFCGHPEQTDKQLKRYAYYNFSCLLHEKGVAQSRIDYNKTLAQK